MAIAWSRISSKVTPTLPTPRQCAADGVGIVEAVRAYVYRRWVTKESHRSGSVPRRRATVRADMAGDPRAASLPPTRHALSAVAAKAASGHCPRLAVGQGS